MSKRVTHLTVGLGKGGAETMLYQVLKYRTNPDLHYKVISLSTAHYYEEPIRQLGIEVTEVNLCKRPISSLWRILRELHDTDTLCCWMYHANLIGYYLGKLAGVKRIVWNIRHSNLDPAVNSATTLKINRWCAKRSAKVAVIAYNGQQARKVHEEIGYCSEKEITLDNGVDCAEFRPMPEAGTLLRAELGIRDDQQVVLSVTKNHPIKDIPTFIQAFALLHKEQPDTVAVMCGSGVDTENKQITDLCLSNGLTVGEDIFLLGMRHDVPHLLSGCDLYVLHSAGEAFPNTLIQAMACGCLCVATDVGDVRTILNDDAFICTPQEPKALAEKISEALCLPVVEKTAAKEKNRSRAVSKYSIQSVVKAYEEIL